MLVKHQTPQASSCSSPPWLSAQPVFPCISLSLTVQDGGERLVLLGAGGWLPQSSGGRAWCWFPDQACFLVRPCSLSPGPGVALTHGESWGRAVKEINLRFKDRHYDVSCLEDRLREYTGDCALFFHINSEICLQTPTLKVSLPTVP